MARWIPVDEQIHDYIESHLEPEIDVLQALRRETATLPGAGMQISHEQARFMSVILRAMHATRTIEIGVYTGYSTLITALALPPDGRVVACDINEEWTTIAQRYWQLAGVADRIDLQLAPASQTLARLIEGGQTGEFDFAFIDADKGAYAHYFEQVLQLLRPGGLIMFDNMLWKGAVVDAADQEADTLAIRDLNEQLAQDGRVAVSLVPVGDGISLACKR